VGVVGVPRAEVIADWVVGSGIPVRLLDPQFFVRPDKRKTGAPAKSMADAPVSLFNGQDNSFSCQPDSSVVCGWFPMPHVGLSVARDHGEGQRT
jgi:hypothetical protein